MPSRPFRRFFTLLLLTCLLLASTTLLWGTDYNGLISQAREQLQNEQFVEALATAKDAVRADANDYKGHYYAAMAYLGLARFDDAEAAAGRSLQLAAESAKPGVEKLVSAIKTRRSGLGSVQAADAALADGLAGKAARLYEQAWSAGQEKPELGLKAADLYANRLSQPVDAGRVLRQVMVAAKGSPAADQATTELAKLAAELRRIAEGYVEAAKKEQGAAALQSLQLAEEADPTYLAIFELRAQLAAMGESVEALQSAIKELAKRDRATPKTLASLPRMTQWLQQPAFNEFMIDLIGSKKSGELRQLALNPPDSAGDFIDVPAGCFTAGGKQVCLSAFRIGQYEVTQWQYQNIMGSNPSRFSSCGDDCPVEQVSWEDAQSFITRLNSETGKRYRLPTEAEWEYACRSGGKNEEYCGGNNVDIVAWYKENSGAKTHPVGQKQANGFGLYDMSGNVWEWVSDRAVIDYPGSGDNPQGPSSGTNRVLRGGSSIFESGSARAAYRNGYPPDEGAEDLGFRLVSPVQ